MATAFLDLGAQKNTVQPVARITANIDDADRVPLRGHVHPLARPEFDAGLAPSDLPMDRIVLILRGSAEQNATLEQLLIDLHNPSSPRFHQWLTPDEFGRQFGVASQDIAAVTRWLEGKGFQVNHVSRSRRMVEFDGTVAQVNAAFGAGMHRYLVNGAEHLANAQEPTVPAALLPVVSGFVSLHNFKRRSLVRVVSAKVSRRGADVLSPQFNAASGTHQLTPYDVATIYNILPLWSNGIDGTGQTIAIVSRSNVGWGDIAAFRNTFHMDSTKVSAVFNGNDPGLVPGDIDEAESDAEWSSAIAKNANVKLVVSASTSSSDGIDLSSIYAVDNVVAPVLSVSYSGCEIAGDSFYASLWQQAAAEGISVVVAAGDSGSAGCDDPNGSLATHGFGVNGLASTPDDVAAGGTALNEGGQDANYWSATNDGNLASALGYIPETVWNDSSTSSPISLLAGSGGVSTIFSTPLWQTGNGVPSSDPDNSGSHHRYLPDVSLAAAQHDDYFVCLFDSTNDCAYVDSTGIPNHDTVNGTSVSAQVFAGIMALVNQQAGSPQGNPNFHLYPLSTVSGVFHDVTSGTNAVPCSSGTGCVNGTMSGYNAGPGYDLATGWGSVDVNALVTNWSTVNFMPTTVTGSSSQTTFQHGSPITLAASVSASSGTPSGGIAAYGVHNGATLALGAKVIGGTDFSPTNIVPGGTSSLYFRYGGDGVFGSSVSSPITLTVTAEPSSTTASAPTSAATPGIPFFVSATVAGQSGVGIPSGTISISQGNTVVGSGTLDPNGHSNVIGTYSPTLPGTFQFTLNYQGDSSFQPSSTSVSVTFGKSGPTVLLDCPNRDQDVVKGYPLPCTLEVNSGRANLPPISGTAEALDGGGPSTGPFNPLGGGQLPLIWQASLLEATANIDLSNLPLGAHSLMASYSGDDSWSSALSGCCFFFGVVPAPTMKVQLQSGVGGIPPGTPFTLSATALAQQYGPSITGSISVYDGSLLLASYSPGSAGGAILTGMYQDFTFNDSAHPWSLGTHVLTLQYGADPFWPTTTSAPLNFVISNTPDFTLSAIAPITVKRGSSSSTTFQVLSVTGFSGLVSLSCFGLPAEASCSVTSAVTPGNFAVLTVSATAPHAQATQSASLLWTRFLAVFPCGFVLVALPRRRRASALWTLAATVLVLSLISCGGGGGSTTSTTTTTVTTVTTQPDPGTPTGNYTMTITATSTSATHTFPVSITVQ